MTPTKAEQDWIGRLEALMEEMPDSIWIFCADGGLYPMRRATDGTHKMTSPYGSVDQDYCLTTFSIGSGKCDGGDW